MNIENHEERITGLENRLAELISIQKHNLNLHEMAAEQNQRVFKISVELQEEILAVGRFLSCQPALGPESERQKFRDAVSRWESQIDFLKAHIKANENKTDGYGPSAPPPEG